MDHEKPIMLKIQYFEASITSKEAMEMISNSKKNVQAKIQINREKGIKFEPPTLVTQKYIKWPKDCFKEYELKETNNESVVKICFILDDKQIGTSSFKIIHQKSSKYCEKIEGIPFPFKYGQIQIEINWFRRQQSIQALPSTGKLNGVPKREIYSNPDDDKFEEQESGFFDLFSCFKSKRKKPKLSMEEELKIHSVITYEVSQLKKSSIKEADRKRLVNDICFITKKSQIK